MHNVFINNSFTPKHELVNNKPIKKILVVAESIDVEDSSGTKGRVALIKNLQYAGFELQVYHYTRKEIELAGIPCYSMKEDRHSLLFFLSRLERYTRYWLKLKLNKYIEQAFGFSFALFNDRNSIVAALKKIKDFEPDLVLTLSKGGSFRPHHALLKIPKWHSKWMAYMHDPYPMYLYPPPFAWPEPGSMEKWKFVKEISENAAYSAFPSKLLKEWMGGYFPGFQEKAVVIPHQISEEDIINQSLPSFFDPEKFNLLHGGTLLAPRKPAGLILAYEKFLEQNPEAKADSRLIFIGNTRAHSRELAGHQELIKKGNLIISKSLKYQTILQMQAQVTVNIILEAKSEISPFLPGKFPHCVIADKPILLLGPGVSETRRLLGDEYPWWSEIDNIDKIRELIQGLYLEWKKGADGLRLNRPDMEKYLTENNLKSIVQKLEVKE